MSIKGSPTQQKLSANQLTKPDFVTAQASDQGLRKLLDTTTKFAFRVGSQTVPLTAGATTGNPTSAGGTEIEDTGTLAKQGDFVRFIDGDAKDLEIPVDTVSTNKIILAARLPAGLIPASGDEFYIMRYGTQRMDNTGAQIVSVTQGPITFRKDGAETEVSQDTGTPAASVPLPVQIYGAAGEINITAGDIDIHTTHLGANADSMRIGDGTTELVITVGGEAKVADATAQTSLSSIDGKLGSLGQKAMAGSAPVVIASDQSAIPVSGTVAVSNLPATQAVSAASLPLPTGAATEAKQDAAKLVLDSIAAEDFATSALQQAQANLIGATNETAPASDTADSALNGRLQRIAQRITSLIAQIPATLGQKLMAASMSVTIASDQSAIPASQSGTWTVQPGNTANTTPWLTTQPGRSKIDLVRNDYSSVNVTTGAYVQLIASTSAAINKLQIFDSSGQTLVLAVGAAASEVNQIYIFPGGNGDVELAIPAGSRVSVKAVSASATVGELVINFLS